MQFVSSQSVRKHCSTVLLILINYRYLYLYLRNSEINTYSKVYVASNREPWLCHSCPPPRKFIDRYAYLFYFFISLPSVLNLCVKSFWEKAAAIIVFPIALELESFQTGSRIVSFSFSQYQREKYRTFVGNIVGLYYILFIKIIIFFHVSHIPSHGRHVFSIP